MKNGKKLFVALTLSTAFLTSCEDNTNGGVNAHSAKYPTTTINDNSPAARYLDINYRDENENRIEFRITGRDLYDTSDFNAIRNALKEKNIESISPCNFEECIEKVAQFRKQVANQYPKYAAKLFGETPEEKAKLVL